MSKIIVLFFLLALFIVLVPNALANHPSCDSSTTVRQNFNQEVSNPEQCPSNTCYVDSGINVSTRYACYNLTSTQPGPQTPSVSGTANISVSPNPVPKGSDMNFTVTARGFGQYGFIIVPRGSVSEISSASITINPTTCRVQANNTFYVTESTCVKDNNQQTWEVHLKRRPRGTNEDLEAKLADITNNRGYIFTLDFIVGQPQSQGLSVSVSPSGPLKNDISNQVTLTWSPVTTGADYLIDTNVPAILAFKVQRCTTSPTCSRTITIPPAVPGGDIIFTITQEGDNSVSGSAHITMEAVIPPDIDKSSTGATTCTKEDIENGTCTSAAAEYCIKGDPTSGIKTAIGCIHTEPKAFIQDILKFVTAIAGGIAFLLMLLGAFQMITSAGNPETLTAGRERFTSAITGLLFVIFAVLLLKIIGVDILGLEQYFR